MGRIIEAFAQFFDGSGNPLTDGYLLFLESETNNTKKDTYADSIYQIPNANPLPLDAEGRCPNVFGLGEYRVISYQGDPEDLIDPGQQIQVFDPVAAQGELSGGGGGGSTTSFVTWDISTEYDYYDIVTYNTKYYRSLITNNLGLNPAVETGSWEELDFVHIWNDSITYSEGDLVQYTTNLYISNTNLNTNQRPDISPIWWRLVATGNYTSSIKTTDYEILPTERHNVVVLGPGATADSQFDLPAVDATYDLFEVTVYNASDYILTVTALGAPVIWIDTSGEIEITKGASVRFIYIHSLLAWIPIGNTGPTLGGQDIGTPTTLVNNIYAAILHDIVVPDDEYISFGTGSDIDLGFDSTLNSLVLTAAAGVDLTVNFTNDIFFDLSGTTAWQIDSSGHLRGGATVLPNIYLPDTAYLSLGTSDIFRVFSDGTSGYLYTTGANGINFVVNSVLAGLFTSAGNFDIQNDQIVRGTLSVGASGELAISHDSSNGYLNSLNTLTFSVGYPITAALTLNATLDAFFANDVQVNNDLAVLNDLTVSGAGTITGLLTYGSLNDGSTTLQSTLNDIDARCYNVPYIQESKTNGPIAIGTSFATIHSISLGTVNTGSFALIDFGTRQVTKTTNNGGVNVRLTYSGTAVANIGYINYLGTPSVYSVSLTPGSTLSYFGGTTVMYIPTGGTITLILQAAASTNGASYIDNYIRCTWIKLT